MKGYLQLSVFSAVYYYSIPCIYLQKNTCEPNSIIAGNECNATGLMWIINISQAAFVCRRKLYDCGRFETETLLLVNLKNKLI